MTEARRTTHGEYLFLRSAAHRDFVRRNGVLVRSESLVRKFMDIWTSVHLNADSGLHRCTDNDDLCHSFPKCITHRVRCSATKK